MSSNIDLPDCWSRPFPVLKSSHVQRLLFDDSEDEVKAEALLAEIKVSTSDMERWHGNGWISYRLQDLDHLSEQEENEIRFIAPIARSGLSDFQIGQLLKELRAPYAYADDVAYNFKYGWVTPPPHYDIVSANVDGWLEQLAEEDDTERLLELGNKIYDLLHPAEEKVGESNNPNNENEADSTTDPIERA